MMCWDVRGHKHTHTQGQVDQLAYKETATYKTREFLTINDFARAHAHTHKATQDILHSTHSKQVEDLFIVF